MICIKDSRLQAIKEAALLIRPPVFVQLTVRVAIIQPASAKAPWRAFRGGAMGHAGCSPGSTMTC